MLKNIPATKHLTVVTRSSIMKRKLVRYYCKKYVSFLGCAIAGGGGGLKIVVR
jgi:hypothetical protein